MRILFVSSNRIGDAVLTTGVLSWLVSTYPEATFTIACGPATQDLFRAVPRVDKIINLRKEKRHGHWVKLWKQCCLIQWDMIVDLRNSLVTRLLFAKKKVYKVARSTGRHKVEDHASILGLSPPPMPVIWTDSHAEMTANTIINDTSKLLAMAPAANWAPKQWDIKNFINLAKKCVSPTGIMPDAKIMVVAAPHEREQVQALIDAFPSSQVIDLVGYDLLTVAACLKQATLFVGNDSGLMHISAAMGVPTLGLFGPSDERIYGPYGPHCGFVRTPESMAELVKLQPYPGSNLPLLMGSLRLESVLEAVEALYSKIYRASGTTSADPS